MQFDIGKASLQSGPFFLRFLHPVFPEHPVSGFQQRQNVGRIEGFGNRNQTDIFGITIGIMRRHGDMGLHPVIALDDSLLVCHWLAFRVDPVTLPVVLSQQILSGKY